MCKHIIRRLRNKILRRIVKGQIHELDKQERKYTDERTALGKNNNVRIKDRAADSLQKYRDTEI